MINPMGVCGAYNYIDWTLYDLNDYGYPEMADEFFYNLFECGIWNPQS